MQVTQAPESMPAHQLLTKQHEASAAGLEEHAQGILDLNSVFGFQSMLVAQPAFIHRYFRELDLVPL